MKRRGEILTRLERRRAELENRRRWARRHGNTRPAALEHEGRAGSALSPELPAAPGPAPRAGPRSWWALVWSWLLALLVR